MEILTWFLRMVGGWDLFRGSHKARKIRRKEREGVLFVSKNHGESKTWERIKKELSRHFENKRVKVKVKVKQSLCKPGQAPRVPGG